MFSMVNLFVCLFPGACAGLFRTVRILAKTNKQTKTEGGRNWNLVLKNIILNINICLVHKKIWIQTKAFFKPWR